MRQADCQVTDAGSWPGMPGKEKLLFAYPDKVQIAADTAPPGQVTPPPDLESPG